MALAVFLLPAAVVRAQPDDRAEIQTLRDLEQAFVALAEDVRPSVVSIRCFEGDAAGQVVRSVNHGSGFILRRDGYVVTNQHVIEDCDIMRVALYNGKQFSAELVEYDDRTDLAVIRIDATGLKPVKLGDLADVRVGQWAFAVGNPFGLAFGDGQASVTFGNVSAVGKNLTGALDPTENRYYGNLIATSATINPGNSGGPLFNLDGRVIGVVTAITTQSGAHQGMGFAIPISERTRAILHTLEKGESVRYGYLGVQLDRPSESDLAAAGLDEPTGAKIVAIPDDDVPAQRARLRAQDLIVEFDGVPVEGVDHLMRLVGATPVGETVTVSFIRDRQHRTAEVKLSERPRFTNLLTFGWAGAVLAEMDGTSLHRRGLTRRHAGIVVVNVEHGSPVDHARLRADDIIMRVNGTRVRNHADFLAEMRRSGAEVQLDLLGDKTVVVKLDE